MKLDLKNLPGNLKFSIKRVVLWAALFLCFCPVVIAGWLLLYAQTPGPAIESDSVVVTIPRGASVNEIGHLLAQAELIHEDVRFQFLAKITGLSAKLQAGEFRLPANKKPVQMLEELAVARSVHHKITVVEGLRAEEIAHLFAKDGWCNQKEFLRLIRAPETLRSLGVDKSESLEGYLFPDTYYLTRLSTDAESLVRMMVGRFQKVWAELQAGEEKKEGILSLHEIVTLASIVEKETGASEERTLIASVFFNRLQRRMPLQSDPTVIYGRGNFSKSLTRSDLREPTPYNTYVLPALPVGPICNPGRAALEAVLHPAASNYLYFVSKNNGTHHFSRNLKEHNRAVWKYQRNKKKKKEASKKNDT